MRSCIRKFQKLTMRRLISLCILLSVCALLLPLPVAFLRTTGSEKDLSQPFPCQNRPCGCQSAEQCWKKCCCFTNEQKVAWAKTNNVKLPAYVLEAALKEAGFVNAKASGSAAAHCERCVARKAVVPSAPRTVTTKAAVAKNVPAPNAVKSLVAAVVKRVGRPVVKTLTALAAQATTPSAKASRSSNLPATSKWVMTVFAAKCQGQPTFWCCLPPTVLPTPAELLCRGSMLTESIEADSDRLPATSQRPPLPPPKIG